MMGIKDNKFIQLWLILGIMAGFASIIFFSVVYLNEKLLCDIDCRVRNEVSLMLVLLSLFGVFIGSLTYYFISEKYEKRMVKIHNDAHMTLRFLEGDDRTIMGLLIKNGGETTQSDIAKETGLSRVRISRVLKSLEQRDLISKMPVGMTNKIVIEQKLKSVFFK